MAGAAQEIGGDKLSIKGFDPGMLEGVTCSKFFDKNWSTKFWEMFKDFIPGSPADDVPPNCEIIAHSIYNFHRTDPKLHMQGFLDLENFPCLKTCGYCRGMFLFSN